MNNKIIYYETPEAVHLIASIVFPLPRPRPIPIFGAG